jgi:hypothetical protein
MKPHIRTWVAILILGVVLLFPIAAVSAGPARSLDAVRNNDGYGDFYTLFISPGEEPAAGRNLPAGPIVAAVEKEGKPLEWAIPETRLPGSFTWLAVYLDKGSRLVLTQVSNLVVTSPVPGAALLLGSGIICLIGLRRRDRSQA